MNTLDIRLECVCYVLIWTFGQHVGYNRLVSETSGIHCYHSLAAFYFQTVHPVESILTC